MLIFKGKADAQGAPQDDRLDECPEVAQEPVHEQGDWDEAGGAGDAQDDGDDKEHPPHEVVHLDGHRGVPI